MCPIAEGSTLSTWKISGIDFDLVEPSKNQGRKKSKEHCCMNIGYICNAPRQLGVC